MSIQKYSLIRDGNENLSAHFQVREFRCKDGSDTILIDTELIEVLENLRAYLALKAININSGYRTESHNNKMGGSKTSQHLQGKAADLACVGQDGATVPARLVCCAMNDLNYQGGVAYINTTAAHIDTRGKKFWFDESKNNKATNSFYEYFGIARVNPFPTPESAVKRGAAGATVSWVQWQLNRAGASLNIDGTFGPATDTAVRDFQKSGGIDVDGSVGPVTRSKLAAWKD